MATKTNLKPPPLDKEGHPSPTLLDKKGQPKPADSRFDDLERLLLDCMAKNGGCEGCPLQRPCEARWAMVCEVSGNHLLKISEYQAFVNQFVKLWSKRPKNPLHHRDKD